jgi:hypothetical protein
VGTTESALKGVPPPLTIKEFTDKINKETYGKVKDAWTEEANKMRQNSELMKELRKTLQPEVIERIKTQRLAQMESGQRFDKYRTDGGGKERGKQIYLVLDASHKTLHYKDINEGDKDPEYEDLLTDDTSIPVSKIQGTFC